MKLKKDLAQGKVWFTDSTVSERGVKDGKIVSYKISEEYAPVFKVNAKIAHEYGSFKNIQRKDSLIHST